MPQALFYGTAHDPQPLFHPCQDFFLGNPDRLVVDFPGVLNRSPRRTIDVNEDPVQRVRIAQFSADSPRVA
ncbi:MAG: AMIN domain-containing protein, partial [Candidatus Aminicenantaceae bacterium]